MGQEIVNYDAEYAAAAAAQSKQDRGGEGTFLSTRGGILAFGEEIFPGNQVACVIVDSVLQNMYYPNAFDPNNIVAPICYAFTRGEPKEMYPHLESMAKDETYFMPQNMADDGAGGVIIGGCHGCPMDEWGTGKGRGKACKNTARLTLLPAGMYEATKGGQFELGLHDEPEHYRTADPVFLSIPPTSLTAWERYRKMLRVQHGRPPFGAITRIYLTNDAHKQFQVNFELIELVQPNIAQEIIPRAKQYAAEPFQGFEAPQEEEAPPPQAQGRFGAGRGIRR